MSKIDLSKKYTTRDGREVRLIGFRKNSIYIVIGKILSHGVWALASWTIEGRYRINREHVFDLVEAKMRVWIDREGRVLKDQNVNPKTADRWGFRRIAVEEAKQEP